MITERLILFARRPLLGQVKTRLVPPLAPSEALGLHEAMLLDTVARVRRMMGGGRSVEVCFDGPIDPDTALAEALRPLATTLQVTGDLGARLLGAFARSHAEGVEATVIVGADAPTLPDSILVDAFLALRRGSGAVFAPAEDGGYVLIGAREPHPALFLDIPWGGPDVARITVVRAAAAGIALGQLASWYDVDDAPALRRLARELAADPSAAPATAAWLARTLYSTKTLVL